MAATRPRRRRHRPAAEIVAGIVTVVGLAALLLPGCGDDDDGPEEGVLPLLGTAGTVPPHPALAVKIDDTDQGRPQTGLAQADVVFEEMVEGGLTRLMAVYHSQDPAVVGPVRSARSSDLAFLAELQRPLFAWSGANPTFQAEVEAADLVDVGFDAASDAYQRHDDRPAPYNLYADPAALRSAGAEAGAGDAPPPALFEYREADEPLSGDGVEATGGVQTTDVLLTAVSWQWDAGAGRWLRTQDGSAHVDSDGAQVAVDNVVVRATPYRDSGVRDSTGAVVPEAEDVGEGDAWLLSDGQVQAGRWSKTSTDAPTTYTAADGSPLRLTPGTTWVEVLPPDATQILPAP
jgi:DUF3048 family protein